MSQQALTIILFVFMLACCPSGCSSRGVPKEALVMNSTPESDYGTCYSPKPRCQFGEMPFCSCNMAMRCRWVCP